MPNSIGFYQPSDGLYRDEKEFFRLVREGMIKRGQAIRVYNNGTTANMELFLTVGSGGRLYKDNGVEVRAEEVLRNEDGWCFEGHDLSRLPRRKKK